MIAVVQFGGSSYGRDAVRTLSDLGFEAERVWHEDPLPKETTGIVLPGGFSCGDYLRGGVMAARSPIMGSAREVTDDGVPVLGVCDGAQIGCESGLTPGAFTTNASARFQCEHAYLRVENADTRWTVAYDGGKVIELPIAHGEGRFELDTERYEEPEADDRILFRYCDAEGNVTDETSPNGSLGNVAGVLGDGKSVTVLMPHPERALLPQLGNTDGRDILAGFEG